MRRKSITHFSVLVISILLVNYIASFYFFRLDLTTDKRYTLMDKTIEILESREDVVYVTVYLDGDMPVGFQRMRKAIRETLDEFKVYAGKNLQYKFENLSDIENAKKRNAVYEDLFDRGLQPTNVKESDSEGGSSEKVLFPGATIAYQGNEVAVNFLSNNPSFSAAVNLNNSIQTIEYNLINGIFRLTIQEPEKIAFIEGHGELNEFETGDITRELSAYYRIDRVNPKGHVGILDDYAAVIVAGPKDQWPEEDKFVLDQYLMQGGHILWFIDEITVNRDSLSKGSETFGFVTDHNLNDMLFRYGIRINPNIIRDMNCALIPVNNALPGQQARFVPTPWPYYPLLIPPQNSLITKDLNMIKSEFPSNLDRVGNNAEVKGQVILQGSEYTNLLQAPVWVSLKQVREPIDPGIYRTAFPPIAILLEGEFESVFKNRMINQYLKTSQHKFKSKSDPAKMLVVGDADIIRNETRERGDGTFVIPLGYDRYTGQQYGNKDFVMNAVHAFTNLSDILKIRSKEVKLRLLDKAKIKGKAFKWQMINIVLPVGIILILGGILVLIRRRKYSR